MQEMRGSKCRRGMQCMQVRGGIVQMKGNLCDKAPVERSKIGLKEGYDNFIGKKVAIIGLGGTGSLVAELLARMSVMNLILGDFDIVEATNLERQILYFNKDVGKKKAAGAKARLKEFC